MGLIATSKIADCDNCGATNTQCRKRKKEHLCLSCCRKEDVSKQLSKQRERNAVRQLGYTTDKKQAENIVSGAAELQRWFKERRREMVGRCAHCNGRTEKNNEKMFHYSIAHLLPKKFFKSVATHPDNWLELCYHGNSCHTNFDNSMIDIIDLNCFNSVIDKFVKMYPSIAPEERRRIPAILLEYIKTEQ